MSGDKGTSHFIAQRATAVANVPLVIFLIVFVIMHLGASRADVLASIGNPVVAILLILSFVSILWHMRLGLQDVIEDYVHASGRKSLLLTLNTIYVAGLGLAALYAILKMSFGF